MICTKGGCKGLMGVIGKEFVCDVCGTTYPAPKELWNEGVKINEKNN